MKTQSYDFVSKLEMYRKEDFAFFLAAFAITSLIIFVDLYIFPLV